MSKSISELIWYQNLITGESIRIHKDLLPPDGFTHGRFLLNNPGIEKANSLSSVVDLKNRKCSKVKEVQEYHAPQSGKSSENTIIFHFDNYIFTSVKRLVNYLELNEMFIDNHNLTSLEKLDNFRVKVKKKYYNKSKKQFDKSNEGKSLKELGIDYFRLLDYNYNLYIKENRIWHP